MVEPKVAVIAFLTQNADIFAAFGNRITADKIPDGQAFPNARIWIPAEKRKFHHGGTGGRKVLLQIDVYAETSQSADVSASLIDSAMSGYRGMMGSMSVGMCTTKTTSGLPNPDFRMIHRMIEVEVSTND